MRILLDQGLPRSAATILREKDWDISHTGDIGLSRASDREILEYARENTSTIVTLDSDFHAILAVENASSPSVVRIRREGLKGEDLAELIERVWPQIRAQIEAGAMVTITDTSIRLRSIPVLDEQ